MVQYILNILRESLFVDHKEMEIWKFIYFFAIHIHDI